MVPAQIRFIVFEPVVPALHGPEISSRSIGLSPVFAGQKGRLLPVSPLVSPRPIWQAQRTWYGSTGMDFRAPLQRTHPPKPLNDAQTGRLLALKCWHTLDR
jgi:hypothetical protein